MSGEPWFVPALWEGASAGPWSPTGRRCGERFVAIPSRTEVHQLLPWRWSTALAAGQRVSDDRGRFSRGRDMAAAAAMLVLGAVTPSRRMAVQADARIVDDVAAALELPGRSYGTFLFGPARANRKPVLQIHDHVGRTRAWVKVATSDLTRRLLEHEIEALTRLGDLPTEFRVPTVLARGTFGSGEWAALEPMTVDRRRSPDLDGFDAVAQAVERTAPRRSSSSSASSLVARLRDESSGLEHAPLAVERLAARDRPLELAAAHGDLVPWNLLTGTPWPAIWDWERYETDAPVGFDRIHRRVQIAVQRHACPLERAVADAETELRGQPDLPSESWADHVDWYLAVMLCRYERDAQLHPNPRLVGRIADLVRVLRDRGAHR